MKWQQRSRSERRRAREQAVECGNGSGEWTGKPKAMIDAVRIVADDQIPPGLGNAHHLSETGPAHPMTMEVGQPIRCPECGEMLKSIGSQYAVCVNDHRTEIGWQA